MNPGFHLPSDFTCGVFHSVSPCTKDRVVTQYEIEYFLSDGGVRCHGDEEYAIRKGDIHLARPGDVSHTKGAFETLYGKFGADGSLAALLDECPRQFTPRDGEKVRSLLDTLIAHYERGGSGSLAYYTVLLTLIDTVTGDATRQRFAMPGHAAVSDAAAYIESRFAEPLTLEDIAAHAHLSPSYLHACFKKVYHVTPRDYLMRCRVSAAKKLLGDGRVTLEHIADVCGFSSQPYFTKVFRELTGSTPGAYRKMMREGYLR